MQAPKSIRNRCLRIQHGQTNLTYTTGTPSTQGSGNRGRGNSFSMSPGYPFGLSSNGYSSSGGRQHPFSSSSGGKAGRRGSFGGRGNDGAAMLRQVKEVLNRIRWDLVEVVQIDFSEVGR